MIEFLHSVFGELVARGQTISTTLNEAAAFSQEVGKRCREVILTISQVIADASRCQADCEVLKSSPDVWSTNARLKGALLSSYTREYHRQARDLGNIEEQFAGHIVRFHARDLLLTRVAERLWQELDLPGESPLVVASTSGYYNTVPGLRIIFTPLTASESLLTVPDVAHEFGHLLHHGHVPLVGPRFIAALNDYHQRLSAEARQIARPLPDDLIPLIVRRWKYRWAEEVACDTLAARLLGPAYGWCNLQLCLREPEFMRFGSHPANEARTRHINRVIRRCGWQQDSSRLEELWADYTTITSHQAPLHYHDMHSDGLFLAVMEDVEAATDQMPSSLSQSASSLVGRITDVWRRFLGGDGTYRQLEKNVYESFR